MIKVVEGLDQVQEPVQIGIELDAINVGNMIISFCKDCPIFQVDKESEQIQQMYNMDKVQTALKILATDAYDSLNGIN